MIRILYCTLLIAVSSYCFGQPSVDKKAIKLVNKAEEAIKNRKFEEGTELLREAIGRDSAYADAYVKLFGLLNVLRQSAKIHQFQLLYVKHVPEKALKPQIWQSLAHHEMANGEYLRARSFLSKAKNQDSVLYNSIEFALQELDSPDSLIINELPEAVNKFKFQYLPVLTVDNRTLIFTAIEDVGGDEDMVQSTFDGLNWSEAQSISETINSQYNEGACTISADGRTLIFTSCEGRRSFGNCDLYISRKIGDKWSQPKNLGKIVNSRFWDSQPTLSADGKTLYFVSTRPGGEGGRDIWVTHSANGKWSVPQNLGSSINTSRDETTPFIHASNLTLFFSSNGHVGMGGFDLLKADKRATGWHRIKNLGYPINTFHDEVSLFITAGGDKAYFAKEKKSGLTLQSSKLVSYSIPEESTVVSGVTYITGTVKDAETKTALRATLELIDLSNRESLFSTESDSLTGEYFLVLPSGKNYGAFIEKPRYLFEDVSFVTSLRKSADTIDILLHPVAVGAKIVLENIYFDFDSDALDQKSTEELNRVAQLLKKYQTIRVEISGHTDDVGAYDYNQNLSERRAKKIHDFLLDQGIKKTAMVYKGYAHIQPLTSNDSEEGRAKNRRIEIEILSYDKD